MPRHLSSIIVTAFLVLGEARGAEPDQRPDVSRFIFFSVLEGLYEDGVPTEAVDQILARETESGPYLHFVYACPICMPALDAFRTYRARPLFYANKAERDTFGPGLSGATLERLCSEDIGVRLQVIEELVSGWVSRRLDGMRLTSAERTEWTEAVGFARKQGMDFLEIERRSRPGSARASVSTCAVCDAASRACRTNSEQR
jgi:hypothetical protein